LKVIHPGAALTPDVNAMPFCAPARSRDVLISPLSDAAAPAKSSSKHTHDAMHVHICTLTDVIC